MTKGMVAEVESVEMGLSAVGEWRNSCGRLMRYGMIMALNLRDRGGC